MTKRDSTDDAARGRAAIGGRGRPSGRVPDETSDGTRDKGSGRAPDRAADQPSEKDKMLAGALYHPADPEIQHDQAQAHRWLARYNATLGQPAEVRQALLRERFARVGTGCEIRPPFHCDYGYNIALGDGVFLNFNCVVLDVVEVTIGDGTQIAPGVQILTADHPRDPVARRTGLEFGQPVRIGRNAWIGAGALILPGVTIGDDALVGAGSVVTRDVPAGVTVAGNPARPLPGHPSARPARDSDTSPSR